MAYFRCKFDKNIGAGYFYDKVGQQDYYSNTAYLY